jgi:hypothetical protein
MYFIGSDINIRFFNQRGNPADSLINHRLIRANTQELFRLSLPAQRPKPAADAAG